MGTTSSCCSAQVEKKTEILTPSPGYQDHMQTNDSPKVFYQGSWENKWDDNFKKTTYRVFKDNDKRPMLIEITHKVDWSLTKIAVDHK